MEGYFSVLREDSETLDLLPANDSKLFFHLVRRAAYRDSALVKTGALFDSLRGLSGRLGMSVKEVRVSLHHLIIAKLIDLKGHTKRHDICITRYINPALEGTVKGKIRAQEGHSEGTERAQYEEVRSKEVTSNKHHSAFDFESVWSRYPKPRGKKAAARHFAASVKTDQDFKDINLALDHYLADLSKNNTDSQFTQNGSTWFNDWQSWVYAKARTLSPPRAIAGPVVPSWKIVPPPEDLVPASEIAAFQASLGRLAHKITRPYELER